MICYHISGNHLNRVWSGAYRQIKQEHGIYCKRHKRFKSTTDSNHDKPVYDNLLKQEFAVTAPNTAWVSDITYLWTNEGWVYLAAVKDLCSKEIVGYALNKRMTADLVCQALNNAIKYKRPAKGLIVHSDRGIASIVAISIAKSLQSTALMAL